MSTRTVEIRKATNLKSDVLQIPYAYIQDQFGYSVASIQRQIHSEPALNLGTFPDTFPHNILEYYWIHHETGSSNSWLVLGKLTNGLYFFYTATCKNSPLAFLTQFEKTKILGFRMNQLSQGARPFITVPAHVSDVREIARMELEQKRLPIIIKRPMPDGTFEYWRLQDLLQLD